MTSWYRLEPNTSDTALAESAAARVADPLWALARQWQLGEFKGEDAASPIHVRAVLESSMVRTFRSDAASTAVEPLTLTQPLECRVEAEPVLDGPAALLLAAEAGVQFLRRLDAAGLGELRRAVDWAAVVGFGASGPDAMPASLPVREATRLSLLQRRGLDGRRLFRLGLDGLRELLPDGLASDQFAAVYADWRTAYADRVAEPMASGDCWVAERFEHQFSLGVATGTGEVVLGADEFPGGHLDWYSFRIGGRSHALGPRPPARRQIELLPQPATFPGQPAPRWWEFEDRAVYFGNLSAGPADVTRMLVAEFGAVLSDDWYVIPVTVEVGSLNRIASVEVLDVFGGRTAVRSTAANDHDRYGADRPFRYFELDDDESAADGLAPWLLVLPGVADGQTGRPVEHVWLMRDEQANLGWGVEQLVELPTGNPLRRRQQWSPPVPEETAPTWQYRVQTPVPPWWVPFVPERTADGAAMRLRRARLQSWEELNPALVGARGRLLGMARPLRIYEEEVPRGGVQITRQWRRARGADGRAVVWMSRRKRPGRGERGSGLEFDAIRR